MFDANATKSKVASIIARLGFPVTITSGINTIRSFGVFEKIKTAEASTFTAQTRVVLVPGTLKNPPQVGADLTISGATYYVQAVDEASPTGVCLYYKLTVIA